MHISAFIISILAFSIASMDLVLSIISAKQMQQKGRWNYVIFSSTLLSSVFFLLMKLFSIVSFTGKASSVQMLIWDILLLLVTAFLFVYIPYIVTIIIAHPWRNPYKTFFPLTAVVYVAISIANYISPSLLFENIRFMLLFFIIFFCIVVVLKNYRSIELSHVRKTLLALAIACFSLIPLIIISFFFNLMKELCLPILFLASTITILVYLFVDISKKEKKLEELEQKKPFTIDSLSEYHITEREFSVITLIKEGLTNKEIASELNISVNTVNNHIANIFAKTEVRSRIDLLNLIEEVSYVKLSST